MIGNSYEAKKVEAAQELWAELELGDLLNDLEGMNNKLKGSKAKVLQIKSKWF